MSNTQNPAAWLPECPLKSGKSYHKAQGDADKFHEEMQHWRLHKNNPASPVLKDCPDVVSAMLEGFHHQLDCFERGAQDSDLNKGNITKAQGLLFIRDALLTTPTIRKQHGNREEIVMGLAGSVINRASNTAFELNIPDPTVDETLVGLKPYAVRKR